MLTPFVRKDGHIEVPLSRGGARKMAMVHQLVLAAFAGPCPPGQEGCHNNGQPADCALANLRWDTHAANMADMVRHGASAAGERHWNVKLTDADVREIRRLWDSGTRPGHRHSRWCGCTWTQVSIAERFGVSRTRVTTIVSGKARAA